MATRAENLITRNRVLVIGHRGYSSRAPENTLPSFELALAAGVDGVELDYFHSGDSVPVVFHDDTLDRTTDALTTFGQSGLAIGDKPLLELKRLDAGSWHSLDFAGTKLPTVEEALDLIQPRSITVLEQKGGDAATLIRLLERKGVLEAVVVMSFDWQFITDCHRLAPQLVLTALGDGQLTAEQLAAIPATGARIVGWNQKHIGRDEIAAIHAAGFKAWVYTVNDPERAQQLRADGIDALISDCPDEIRKTT